MSEGRSPGVTSEDPRRRARMAISELFLDTELDDATFLRLRDELRASRLSLPELDAIYHDEVAPILCRNLSTTAGVWDGFDPDWLEREIGRRAVRPGFSPLARLRRYLVTRSTIEDWRRLRDLISPR